MKSTAKFLGRAIVSAIILWLCFHTIDIDDILTVFSKTRISYFLYALVLNIIGTIIIKAMITYIILKYNKMKFSLAELININFVIRFYTLIMPRGVATGIRWLKYRQSGNDSDAFILVVFENILNIFILMFTATFFLSLSMNKLGNSAYYAIGCSIIGFFLALVALLNFFSSVFFSFTKKIYLLLNKTIPPFLIKKIDLLLNSARSFHQIDKKTIAYIIALSLLSYAFFVISPYILSKAMHIEIDLIAIAWTRSLVLLMALIPITVAGLGIREAGYISFLGMYAIPKQEALAFSLSIFVIQLIIGAVGLLSEIRLYAINPLLKSFRDKRKNFEKVAK